MIASNNAEHGSLWTHSAIRSIGAVKPASALVSSHKTSISAFVASTGLCPMHLDPIVTP